MKKAMAILILLLAAMSVFGATQSHNVDFGFYQFSFYNESALVSIAMGGFSYRYVLYPGNVGFYYGADGTLAFPTYRAIYTDDYWAGSAARYANALYVMMPLGYRWAGDGKDQAFFLGGGPVIQFLNGVNRETLFGLGINAELGFETNSTDNTDFHFAFQFGWSPGIFGTEQGYITSKSFNSALRFGMTWRRPVTDG